MEKEVADRVNQPVKIVFFSKSQAVVTPLGYDSVQNFIQGLVEKSQAPPVSDVH